MLLDRERPQVLEGTHGLAVDAGVVHDVEERVARAPTDLVGVEQPEEARPGEQGGDEDEQRREEPVGAAQVEGTQTDPAVLSSLLQEQRRDQEPGEDEEQRHAVDVHPRHTGKAGVAGQDGDDGERSDAVELSPVTELPRLHACMLAEADGRHRSPLPSS